MPRSNQFASGMASSGEQTGATTGVMGARRPFFAYSTDIPTSSSLVYLRVSAKTSAAHFNCSSFSENGANSFQLAAPHSSHFPTMSANACHTSNLNPPRKTAPSLVGAKQYSHPAGFKLPNSYFTTPPPCY